MEVRVLKINSALFEGTAKSISVPALSGQMQVLSGHKPLVTTLQAGSIQVIDAEGKEHSFDIEHGYLEVTPEQATVIL